MVDTGVSGTSSKKKTKGNLDDVLESPAIDHIQRIADAFMLLYDEAERYVKYMNYKRKGITVAEVMEDLLYTWPPTRVYQEWFMSFTYPVPRTLKEVAKVPLLMQRDPQIIAKLWEQQFAQRSDVVTAILESQAYLQLSNNAKRSPVFVFPVHVERQGSYNMLLQHVDSKCVLFTSVDSYKIKGIDKSIPYLILTFFDELMAQKGIVLVRGDIVNPKDVSKANAKLLMELTVKFYTEMNLYCWVECFNHRSRDFDFEEFKSKCKQVLRC